jgi:CBS domain-containing protein
MERAYGSSKKLYDALEGVEREWSNGGPAHIAQHMEQLRDRMSCPDISSVLDGHLPVEVKLKANVKDIAQLMKDHHTTAVLVMDKHNLSGIFTSKDIVLRVIAAGLNPEQTSVVRVMTPHPDTCTPDTTILEALRKMHGRYHENLTSDYLYHQI